ncbi:N-carbamoyl-D-amino acid hydrolase [Peptococcaceae bacterium CEB3]|nr:N-carbamoyl-D-amino acid hydrolase [Peptococcaceae bacterium CEB3]
MQPYVAAALQFNPQLFQTESNVHRLYSMVERAAADGAKLIVTPEMATTGCHYRDRGQIAPYVSIVPGAVTDLFSQVARKYECYIAIGLPERELTTGLFYNTAALVGPHGYLGKYRKTHLWETEGHWAAWGNLGIPVFDTGVGRLALLICMDAYFFETFRLAAIQGADVIAFLTNSSGGAIANLQARAAENGLYVVSANRSDREMDHTMKGSSSIWDPTGRLLAQGGTGGEEIVQTLIDPGRFQNRGKLLQDRRRPEIYCDLALHIAPWNSHKSQVSNNVTVACCQYEPVVADRQANMAEVAELLQRAFRLAKTKAQNIELLVLPELTFCGPSAHLNPEGAFGLAEQIETAAGVLGSSTAFVAAMAKSLAVIIVFGLIEQEGNLLYNTAVIVGQDGTVIGRYRKTHLKEAEQAWATPGDEFVVVPIPDVGNVGLAIGSDVLFPEVFALLATKRADMVAIPSAWAADEGGLIEVDKSIHPDAGKAQFLWDIRARDNCFYLLVANYTDNALGYEGGSGVYAIDPIYGLDKSVFLGPMEEDVLITDVVTAPANWYTQDHFLACRRMDETYYPLLIRKNEERACSKTRKCLRFEMRK